MKSQEAKFILQAYRPDGQDAEDPQFAEALEQAKADSELSQWFEEAVQLDKEISAKVQEWPIPPHLKDCILAGQKVVRPRPWWKRKDVLGLAASMAMMLTIIGLWFSPDRPSTGFAGFRHDMGVFMDTKLTRLDHYSRDVLELQQFLAERDAHEDFVMPAGMADLAAIGCRILDWRGEKVSLVCFHAGNGHEIHLMIIDRDALPLVGETPEFHKERDWMTALWARDDKVYLALAKSDELSLASHL